MPRMRSRSMPCPKCDGLCRFTGNLDTGKITAATMPGKCLSPTACARIFCDGIWDHMFEEKVTRYLHPKK